MQNKPLTFRQIATDIVDIVAESDSVEVNEAQVKAVLHALGDVVASEIGQGIGVNLPGIVHLRVVHRPAKPKRMVRNPQTGEERMAAPKPASFALKARPSHVLKAELPTTRSAVGKALAAEATKASRKRQRAAAQREREHALA